MEIGLAAMVITFVVCLVIGVPMLAVIGLATMVPMLIERSIPLTLIPQAMYSGVNQFPLVAVTGFILAGALMDHTGINDSIIRFARSVVGSITGGFAAITIFASTFFAALSGSGPATTAAVGSVMIPAMKRHNYTEEFAASTTAAGGTLGILVPPSNPMIIYAIVANISVTRMFMAGFFPGLLGGVFLIITAYLVSVKKGFVGTAEKFSWTEVFTSAWKGKWALLAPVIILGGIYGGIFTPTEAAVVAVFYALLVGIVINRTMTPKKLYKALASAALVSGTVIVIVGVAVAFGRVLTLYRVPQVVAEGMTGLTENPYLVMMLVALLLLIVGTFMETLAKVIIFTPIFMPMVRTLGIDPYHFGIVFIVCCQVGFITPPLGANLYVATQISSVPIERIFRSVLPYLATFILFILLLIYLPQISLILPRLLMGL